MSYSTVYDDLRKVDDVPEKPEDVFELFRSSSRELHSVAQDSCGRGRTMILEAVSSMGRDAADGPPARLRVRGTASSPLTRLSLPPDESGQKVFSLPPDP